MFDLCGFEIAQAFAIVWQGDEEPFEFYLFDASEGETIEAEDVFDDAEDRFDRTLSKFVFGFGLFGLEFLLHRNAPRGFYLPRRFATGLGWSEVVLDLSRFDSASNSHLGYFSFECDWVFSS